ncbi:uncharacterized protein LOC125654883 isoform X2 [Ostrea edulis]|uniref:uncharacterized protein LOC125654883 isoform X2 n=1 Tax=Ostrea edulis TaxID=37623 RepID=UPI0024AFBFBA|nr:uncharacterized protein LOC125654883 isoform X2 [Ostrea edulis]
MASLYASQPETTNANRACRVVLGPCTDSLRDLLRQKVPPYTFHHVIKQNKLNLPRLTAVQRDLILPKNGGYMGVYNDMDISLLYILLRNISNISPHSKGWGNDPDPHDTSLSANIERIRLVRNRCVHSCDPSMSNTDFNSIWSTIRSTMVDLDAFLMNRNKYEKAVDFLRHESMDPENDLHYEEELRKQVEEDKTTRKMVVNLKRRIEQNGEGDRRLDGKIEETTKKARILEEQYGINVEKWREEDKVYYETHSFSSMMEKMRKQPCVTFVGVPGSGKSATAHHIALKLQEEGYEIVPTKDINKIEDYGDPKNPQVFVIDDVVGVFGLKKTKLDVLTDYEQKITQPCMVKSRTLMTCRDVVFNETLPHKSFLTKEENVIKLHGSDHALDDHDKNQILQMHGLSVNLILPALLTSTSRMFPLLCKLFSKETKFQALGSKFFLNPVQCIIDELDDMQRHNKLNYATLVLCMINENRLSENILEDIKNEYFVNMKNKLLKNCRLEQYTDTFKFMDALSAMEGTYTKQCDAKYTFIHDSMFEICAYQYGKQFPDQMLQYMSSSYIANNVKPQTSEPNIVKVKEKRSDSQSIVGRESSNDRDGKEKESDDKNNEREDSFDLCIRLRQDQYTLLAERLYRDIQNMELYDVFRNQVLKHSQVYQAFIRVLETKSYTELKSVFLSSQGKVDKIAGKRKCVVEESEERDEWTRQTVLVDYRSDGSFLEIRCNVRVISWVIYYGHYQILEYIVQQTEKHNEVSELFGITGNYPQESRSEIFEKNIVFHRSRREIMVERSGIETCNNQENNRPVEQSTSGIYTCIEQGNEINMLVEECRLLLLCCYSGDVQTIGVLLPLCKKVINGIDQIREDISWYHHPPLINACAEGHASIVEELVKAGADVNLQRRGGCTPLIAASKRGHVSIVEELVKAGADINAHDLVRDTPLVAACEEGHVSIVEKLVKAGANVNLQNMEEYTPLIAASERGHVSIVKELVEARADVNLQGIGVLTPLIAACEGGHVSVVEDLVKAGANVNLQDGMKNTPLMAAYNEGHVSLIEGLVKAGANVNLQDIWGCTPLIAACEGGDVSVVEDLVKAGANVNLQDKMENTPLMAACKGGHVSLIEGLVKAGANVNLKDKKNTPLIAACKGGHVNIVGELVKAKASVNLKDEIGNTPLIAACEGGHVSIVEDLVNAGADVNLQGRWEITALLAACEGGHVNIVGELVKAKAFVNLKDEIGNTPLIAACEGGHVSIVEDLVNAGADVNLQGRWGDTALLVACEGGHVSIVKELVKARADVNLHGDGSNSPLIAACEEGHVNIVEELVKAGAAVNLQGNYSNTPLIAACEGGHVSVVEDLVKAGADANLQDKDKNMPLVAACWGGHVSIVKELVRARADVNLHNIWGYTPLIAACGGGHVSVVEDLVKAGADANLQNRWGDTPLIAACEEGHVRIVEELVKAGADANLQDKNKNTPLVAACGGGHVSIVKELVKAGADANLQDKNKNTPLVAACGGGHVSIVKELVKAGADVNLQNKWWETPLVAAVREGSLSIVKCLVEYGADLDIQVVDINVSAVCKALILNKPDIVKYLIQEQNKIIPGKFNGNVHLFNCLVDIRHAGVKTDSRDDVVVTDRSVWCMDRWGDMWKTISNRDSGVLRHLLCLGLDVNQSIQLCDKSNKSDVRPLLYILIDDSFNYRMEKVRILLGAGMDVNIRVRYREYDSVLDREGVSVLERTMRLLCKYCYDASKYKRAMCELKKHVRRHSV